MVEMEEYVENNSDEEVNDESHKKLLSAVNRIYKKQRVEKPVRSEPCANVSEYNLSNHNNNEGGPDKVKVYDLVNVLNEKASHQKVQNKFKALQNYSNKLAKPLEKVHADKIKRAVGYEHLKKNVSRWSGVIDKNRSAPQLSFPLKEKEEVKVYKPLSFLQTFSKPTELELEMAEVLKTSTVAEEESKIEKSLFNLSLPEIIEKRKLIAGLKAKESFKIVKAIKQNKIKSKKYRRILRKEKMKQALKDFETLQKTDPEAALEQLNKIEKERAEERATLRHRNTGKWAKSKAIRAKYDVEARKELAEQITKSRELTQKTKPTEELSSEGEDSDSESEGHEKQIDNIMNTSDNPWTTEEQEQEQTIDDFISGYQNYWKNKKKVSEPKKNINKAALARLLGKDKPIIETESNSDSDKILPNNASSSNILNNETIQSSNTDNDDEQINNNISISNHEREQVNDLVPNISDDVNKTSIRSVNKNVANTKIKLRSPEKDVKKKKLEINKDNKINKIKESEVKSISEINYFSDNKIKECDNIVNNKRKKKINTKKSIVNVSGSWEVSCEDTPKEISGSKSKVIKKKKISKNSTLDDIFDNMEDELHQKVQERINNFENILSSSDDEKPRKKKNKVKDNQNKKKSCSKPVIEETTSSNVEEKDDEVEELLKIIENDDNTKDNGKEPDIDPSKFLNVKPRIISSQLPDVITEGDDILDDPEDNRRTYINEAFADDDVVDEFRKEKEEEIEKSKEKDIDLFLPGWGSWTGPNIDESQVKRKRKRFFKKAPKLIRKDLKKANIILNNDLSEKYKEHFVSDVPYPFTSVKAFEASIRAPLGSTFVPEKAVKELIKPPVVKKMGTIIEPMNEDQLLNDKKQKTKFKITNIDQDKNIK